MPKRSWEKSESNEFYYTARSINCADFSETTSMDTSASPKYKSSSNTQRFGVVPPPVQHHHQMLTSTPLSRPGAVIRPVHLRYTKEQQEQQEEHMEANSLAADHHSNSQSHQSARRPTKEELERAEQKYQQMYAHLHKPTKKMGLRI